VRIVTPSADNLTAAAAVIHDGQIVAYPAESMYGLGVDPFNETAVNRLYTAKGRDTKNPTLIIVSDYDQLDTVVTQVSDAARKYMLTFWPGPLTLVLPASPRLVRGLLGENGRVAVRMPQSEIARQLCTAVGHAITSTSANRSGMPAARSAQEVTIEGVDLVLDGGILLDGEPSTVFDPDKGIVYREGAISAHSLVVAVPS
jgi:L-threonylcarbamoyladenylate synthase